MTRTLLMTSVRGGVASRFDDVASGITYLQTALKLLTQPS